MSDLTTKAIKGIYNTKNLTEEQIKKHKRYGKEFIDNLTGIYICENFALSKIMDCRTPTAIQFRSKLGFNQHDLLMTKQKSILTRVVKIFTREKILLQNSVLSYGIYLYFFKHKLGIEDDEKGH